MAGRTHKGSASESETPSRHHNRDRDRDRDRDGHQNVTTSSSRTSQKARNQQALQQQQSFLQKHINSNGPKDRPRIDPLDFEKMDEATLLRYKDRYNINLPRPESLNSDILNSEIGKKTISKGEFANQVKNHFMGLQAKENDIITGFLYKVKHQDKEFKLTFQ
ncbi:hypothetical protein KGF57_001623 [Candida theae]|uniref:Histone deacetylase complex subunit SAP30 Sin3 binding domain-containing protein n=1 Tax=Candida theae TaxID=1198502 RepID=A0AAD5FZL4_9ASCO|nr:uncharacterized protein KGF57_001623 [Candida theae]KAI5961689.1 hypothetical protein KGF57_001623 [Candida theae]